MVDQGQPGDSALWKNVRPICIVIVNVSSFPCFPISLPRGMLTNVPVVVWDCLLGPALDEVARILSS
jgi:hypothetical protein